MNIWGKTLNKIIISLKSRLNGKRHSRGRQCPPVPLLHCPKTCWDCLRSELNLSLPRFVVHLLLTTRTTSETLCKESERRWQGNWNRNRKKHALHGRHSSSKCLRNACGLTKNWTLVCENLEEELARVPQRRVGTAASR